MRCGNYGWRWSVPENEDLVYRVAEDVLRYVLYGRYNPEYKTDFITFERSFVEPWLGIADVAVKAMREYDAERVDNVFTT